MKEDFIKQAKVEISKHGPGGISILSLSKAIGVPKQQLYAEFNNREGVMAAVLTDLFVGLYNISVSINDVENFNVLEKITAYYALCVMKPLRRKKEIGVHFLLHNAPFWENLDGEKRIELEDAYFLHFNFIERVLERHQITINKDELMGAKLKMHSLERGMLLIKLNIFTPCKCCQEKDIIHFMAREVAMLFKEIAQDINEDNVAHWIGDFLSSIPNWAE
ncbi:hypothetical protein [Shewanella sp. YIC-542]|uniref:hypothetical protein n=1 Tax=Shewanella mytili TaxID=3377111 RepID=UPI00398ED891